VGPLELVDQRVDRGHAVKSSARGARRGAPGRGQAAAVEVELVVVDVDPVVVVAPVVVVDDVEVVVVVEPVDDVVEVEAVVVVHGAVTVTVEPGAVTVTVFVLVLLGGQAPSLSPRRRCAFTALLPTTMVTSRFEPVRWHMTTFFGFFLANDVVPATAIETAKPVTKSASRTALSFKRFTPSCCFPPR